MRTRHAQVPLSAFLKRFEKKKIRINPRYQRSGKVWPSDAKTYLVESVICGKVVPRLVLHRVPASATAPKHDDIVDGQQRTASLLSFRKNEFELSGAVDRPRLKGRRYGTLSANDRSAFDAYKLQVDIFEDAQEVDIREYFRRINFYTAPLNPEEQRHALFQGDFKWFIESERAAFRPLFEAAGVLTDNKLNRMADAKLLAEIVHALLHGVTTTNKTSLKRLYRDKNARFAQQPNIERRLRAARIAIESWPAIPRLIAKPHHIYAILLALLHLQRSVPTLSALVPIRGAILDSPSILTNLNSLAAILALDEDGVPEHKRPFYTASSKGTNVKGARETRFRWYCRALSAG